MKKRKISAVSAFHFFRLIYRSILFILALAVYIYLRIDRSSFTLWDFVSTPPMFIVWGSFMIEMIFRFFPSKIESPGCQKQFKKNYHPTGRTDIQIHDNNAVMIVALIWIVFNALIGGMYMLHWIDNAILILIALAFSMCDMICILFFCPFQTWFLKNRCCSSCRIYNWDYAMMFTPLFFIPHWYTWTLLGFGVLLVIRWELAVWLYPERFSENTNEYLACKNCTEKLCSHKKQLVSFRKSLVVYAEKQMARILQKTEEEIRKGKEKIEKLK
jgi:hypothetical protein